MKKTLLFVSFLLITFMFSEVSAQSVLGKWKTIDDETGKVKSIVQIYKKDGKLYGKIIKLFKKKGEDQDPICDVCPGKRKNKKVIGMNIITALEKDGNEWEGDEGILDPNNGKLYDCKLWLDEDNPNKLQVRGYILFIYRTQTWIRVK